jgi:hypothetical protein
MWKRRFEKEDRKAEKMAKAEKVFNEVNEQAAKLETEMKNVSDGLDIRV